METKIFLNAIKLEVKWSDLDPYNHLNNSKYYDFMTEARARLFWDYSLKGGEIQLILHECKISFKKAFIYPDKIIIEQYRSRIDGASFELNYIFKSSSDENIIHAEAEVKMVCFDPVKKRVCRIPQMILDIIKKV